jgi:hypothetical protein
LELKLENGQAKTFRNVTEGCAVANFDVAKCIHYRLVGYRAAPRAFVVDRAQFEGGDVVLLGRRTGQEFPLPGVPIASPTGRWLIALTPIDGENQDYDIAVWWATDPPKLDWKYTAPADTYEAWRFVRWEGDSRARLRVWMHADGKNVKAFNAELVRGDKGWELHKPKIAR